MATDGLKKHSKFDKQDIVQGLVELYKPPDFAKDPAKCIDIIAVPGLGSDMKHTWMAKDVHWLQDSEMLQKVVPNARICVFGYRSQWIGRDAVQTRISSNADYLLHSIDLERRGKNSKRPIIFLGHSLGGLVIAKAVSEAKRRPEDYPGIFSCITSCVFLGTPFRGSEAQPFAKIIGMAGETLGFAQYNDLLKSLKVGSIELDELANDFLGDSRKAAIDIVCFYETENTMAKPEWDVGKVFKTGIVIASRKSSTFEGYPNYGWARTHTEMNKFTGPKDVQYRDVSGTLKDLAQKSARLMKLRQDSVRQDDLNDARVDRITETLEVINLKKDMDAIRRTQGTSPSWIQSDPRFIEWKSSKAHANLWISGSPGMGKAKAAISTVDDLLAVANGDRSRDDSPALSYFFCDEQDRDKSKAINVLKMLVFQLLKSKRFLARHFFTDDNKTKGTNTKGSGQAAVATEYNYTLPELWKCLKSALVDPGLGTVYFLVNGFDQIDSESRKEFLGLFTSWQPPVLEDEDGTAPVIKWLILSTPRPDIRDALQSATRIDLDDGSNATAQNDALRSLVAEGITRLAKKKKYSRSLEYYAKSYISFRAEGKSNHDWVNLVCLELEYDDAHYTAIRQHLESLPSDLGPMYDQLSKRVLSISPQDVECSKEILRSLLLVFSPPTLQELAVIADLPRGDDDAIIKHVRHCGAFAQVFEDDGVQKVQLSYNSVRDYLKSKSDDWLSMPSEQIQHGIIALRCFEYVRAAVKKIENTNKDEDEDNENENEDDDDDDDDDDDKSKASTEVPDVPTVDGEVLKYPYTKWVDHALEATPDIVESFGLEEMFWLLESEERMEWSRNYATMNEEEQFDEKFTALHIAAYFGYVPLANLLLRDSTHTPELAIPDSSGHYPLYWAASGGHMNMVQKLVEQGADVNGYGTGGNGQNGLTALHGAAESDSMEIVEYLLANGAQIDVIDEDNGTALYAAVEAESIPIIQLLLNKGASPNSVGGNESTPLNCAAEIGNLEIVQLLLARGAELNPDMTYRLANALGAAAYQGYDDVAKYLLERGCDTNKADFQGEFPLALAAQEGYEEIVALILEYDREPQSHDQALDCAVKANELECVKVLIEKCPMVLRSDPFAYAASNGFSEILKVLTNTGVTSQVMDKCLYEAADYQHIETVEVLLQMGANPDAEGEEFGNALQAAAFDGTTEIIRLLLDAHANPNRVYGDDTYGTALQAAAYEGSLDNVELLVERGAKINVSQCGKYGSALQAACHADSRVIVEYLLSKGVNPNVRGGPLTYPIIAATHFGYATIVEYLVAAGADVNVRNEEDNGSALINAAMQLPLAIIKLLVERGANIHDVDNDGDNALNAAASAGDEETIVYLMDKGIDIQRIGKYGGALYRSVGFGAEGCMRRLLERGIDVNQEGGPLHTTLQAACSLGNLETVELLLEHKANVNITGGTFHTALQAAVSVESVEIVQRLLDNGAEVNAHGGRHGSALHAAVRMKNQELIDLLLEHEADINAIDDYSGSVLALACRRASTDIVMHLIEKGADVKVRGGKYDTALQASCYCEAVDEVKMLLEHGADPTIEGGYYKSAFGAAASRDSVELMEVFLAHDKELPAQMLVEALYTAVHFRKPDAVKFLLDKCPNIAAKSTQYDSLMEALETPLSDQEKLQLDYDGDAERDGDGEDEDDSDDEDEMTSEVSSEASDESVDVEAAQAQEIFEGIKEMLTEALKALEPIRPLNVIKQEPFQSGYSAYNPQQNYVPYNAAPPPTGPQVFELADISSFEGFPNRVDSGVGFDPSRQNSSSSFGQPAQPLPPRNQEIYQQAPPVMANPSYPDYRNPMQPPAPQYQGNNPAFVNPNNRPMSGQAGFDANSTPYPPTPTAYTDRQKLVSRPSVRRRPMPASTPPPLPPKQPAMPSGPPPGRQQYQQQQYSTYHPPSNTPPPMQAQYPGAPSPPKPHSSPQRQSISSSYQPQSNSSPRPSFSQNPQLPQGPVGAQGSPRRQSIPPSQYRPHSNSSSDLGYTQSPPISQGPSVAPQRHSIQPLGYQTQSYPGPGGSGMPSKPPAPQGVAQASGFTPQFYSNPPPPAANPTATPPLAQNSWNKNPGPPQPRPSPDNYGSYQGGPGYNLPPNPPPPQRPSMNTANSAPAPAQAPAPRPDYDGSAYDGSSYGNSPYGAPTPVQYGQHQQPQQGQPALQGGVDLLKNKWNRFLG